MSSTDSVKNRAPRPSLPRVHLVEPSRAAAERLWRYYQTAYYDDDALLARVCDPDSGINGLTEPRTVDSLLAAMSMDDTVTLEAEPPKDAASGGFIIARHSGHGAVRAAFQQYFLKGVFHRDALRFTDSAAERDFFRTIDAEPVMYLDEFVSLAGREFTASLMLACYNELAIVRLQSPETTLLGKCLDSAQIGRCQNLKGNLPIKTLIEALGQRPIARCDQVRRLQVAARTDLLRQAFPETPPVPDRIDCRLTFTLYFGSSHEAANGVLPRLHRNSNAVAGGR